MAKHQNNGACEKCKELFDKYPNFNKQLRGWFVMFQAAHPEAHISCAGRGSEEQEANKKAGRSNANYGKSAHNFNAAIDLFCNIAGKDIYDKSWFNTVVAPEIPDFLVWYGAPGAKFPELPHIEVKDWRNLKIAGVLKLVEEKIA